MYKYVSETFSRTMNVGEALLILQQIRKAVSLALNTAKRKSNAAKHRGTGS